MPDLPACCTPAQGEALDQVLYAAYNRGGDPASAGLNFRGEACPTWDELPENVRAKWGATATAARDWTADRQPTLPERSDFGAALEALKAGKRVRRAGWNGKGMWLALTEGSVIDVREVALRGAAVHYADEVETGAVGPLCRLGAHIDMRAADGTLVIGWLASQTDMLADDWEVLEG